MAMETPSSSARKLTRSEAAANPEKSKQGPNGDRTALFDITNDSPVVGLATGCLLSEKTPLSAAVKSCASARQTPGSGEEVLRGQVRTLLQKVEEETELVPFGQHHHRLPSLLGLLESPSQLLAPTPVNTPQLPGGLVPLEGEPLCVPSQVVGESSDAADIMGAQECQINRALTFDSPEKSGMSTISSSLTYDFDSSSMEISSCLEDDNSSVWSIQANASPNSDSKDVEVEEQEMNDGGDGDLWELCEDMRKISVMGLPEFTGKHTRFVYNSEDEMEEEEEKVKEAVSPSVLVLKGLPVPEGKHLRFQEEDE